MTRLSKASGGIVLGVVLSWIGVGQATPANAQETLRAEVRLRGGILADTTVGGLDETRAEWTDSNSVTDSIHTRSSGGELLSNTAKGLLEGAIYSEIDIPGSFQRASAFVEMHLGQTDTFTVGAGSSGLSNGDPVQVRIQALASSTMVLKGNPSASSEIVFNVEGVPGVTGRWVDWYAGPFAAPQDLEFEEYWEIVADTTVGASFTLMTNFEALIGTNSFEGPLDEPERSDFTGIALVRVSPAEGYEDTSLTSEAGSPTTPIILVPASSRTGLVVLLAILASTAVLILMSWRRPRRPQRGGTGAA
jgi:hypothetical protein